MQWRRAAIQAGHLFRHDVDSGLRITKGLRKSLPHIAVMQGLDRVALSR